MIFPVCQSSLIFPDFLRLSGTFTQQSFGIIPIIKPRDRTFVACYNSLSPRFCGRYLWVWSFTLLLGGSPLSHPSLFFFTLTSHLVLPCGALAFVSITAGLLVLLPFGRVSGLSRWVKPTHFSPLWKVLKGCCNYLLFNASVFLSTHENKFYYNNGAAGSSQMLLKDHVLLIMDW